MAGKSPGLGFVALLQAALWIGATALSGSRPSFFWAIDQLFAFGRHVVVAGRLSDAGLSAVRRPDGGAGRHDA